MGLLSLQSNSWIWVDSQVAGGILRGPIQTPLDTGALSPGEGVAEHTKGKGAQLEH